VVPPGKHTLEFDFKYDGLGAETLQYGSPSGLGRSGTGYLKVDGKVVATKKMEKTVPMLMQWCESFDVGADTGSPVADEDYQPPFRFTGTLDKLTLTIDRPKLSPEDIRKLKAALHANPASE
jgi:arylsulfatase